MKLKAIYLFAIFVLLAACAPQVTVTSEVTVTSTPPPTPTPVPTPTFHPAFIDLQTQIASTGERFTLGADGSLWDGQPQATIDGVRVSSDGVMSLTLADGTSVMLESGQVNFDDEKGFGVDGYELDDDGEWGVAMSEAVQQAQADFEKYGFPIEGLEWVEDENGVRARDPENRKIVYEDGKFSQKYVVEWAGDHELMPTDIEPREDILKATGKYYPADNVKEFAYSGPLFKRMREQFQREYEFDPYVKGKTAGTLVMLDPDINAWGDIMTLDYKDPTAPRYLYYELADGTIYIVPLK
jgi:hypothetical protein